MMIFKKASKTQLIFAVGFAVSMLLVSLLAGDHENANDLLTIMICVYAALTQIPGLRARDCKARCTD